MLKLVNIKIDQDLTTVEQIYFHLLSQALAYYQDNELKKPKKLVELLDQYSDENEFPFANKNFKKISDEVRKALEKKK